MKTIEITINYNGLLWMFCALAILVVLRLLEERNRKRKKDGIFWKKAKLWRGVCCTCKADMADSAGDYERLYQSEEELLDDIKAYGWHYEKEFDWLQCHDCRRGR